MHIIFLAFDGLLVVLAVPYQIQRRCKLACLPMIVAVPEDFPSSLHLAKVFFTDISRCVSPFLGCFTSLIEVFSDYSCVFSNLGRQITIDWRAIYMLYVKHHNVFALFRSCTSTRFVFVVY